MLSIIQTTPTLDRVAGGTARAVTELSDSLAQGGCQVSLIHVAGKHPANALLPRLASARAARGARIGNRNLWAPDYGALLAQTLHDTDATLIHDNGLWERTHVLAARIARSCSVPLVLSPHGMLDPWALAHRRWRKRVALGLYQKAILNTAALLVVASVNELNSVRRAGLTQPVALIPAGVHLPANLARHDVQAEFRTALFLSRLHPVKGLMPLIEAWSQLRPAGWRAVIAGPDELGHRAELERRVAELGLVECFEFTGEVAGDRKQQLFEAADLFVLPSRSENFGIAIAEALSYGVPVLTTQATPWAVLEKIDAGWSTGLGVEDLLGGLRAALATTAAERAAMGVRGRHYVGEKLGWSRVAAMTLAAYRWVLDPKSGRPSHVHLN